jgi:hypothetical protein
MDILLPEAVVGRERRRLDLQLEPKKTFLARVSLRIICTYTREVCLLVSPPLPYSLVGLEFESGLGA